MASPNLTPSVRRAGPWRSDGSPLPILVSGNEKGGRPGPSFALEGAVKTIRRLGCWIAGSVRKTGDAVIDWGGPSPRRLVDCDRLKAFGREWDGRFEALASAEGIGEHTKAMLSKWRSRHAEELDALLDEAGAGRLA